MKNFPWDIITFLIIFYVFMALILYFDPPKPKRIELIEEVSLEHRIFLDKETGGRYLHIYNSGKVIELGETNEKK